MRKRRKAGSPSKVPGHPVYTYIEENREAKNRYRDLKRALEGERCLLDW